MRVSTILVIAFLTISNVISAQQQSIVNMYTPLNVDFYRNLLESNTSVNAQKEEYIRNMMSWIIEIKSATNDYKLDSELDPFYNDLNRRLNSESIADLNIYRLCKIDLGVHKSLSDYNIRLRSQSQKSIVYPRIDFKYFRSTIPNGDYVVKGTEYLRDMMAWIIDLKSYSSEPQLLSELNAIYSSLDNLMESDEMSSLNMSRLSEFDLKIKNTVLNYNRRIANR